MLKIKATQSEIQAASLVQTANDWSSNRPYHGLALLSLGATRRIHSEEHRRRVLFEIDQVLRYLEGLPVRADRDVREVVDGDKVRVLGLRRACVAAKIGAEWISDRRNLAIKEMLFQAGDL